ncbi:MAG: hypothetical protein ABSC11_13880 [Smithella sp.]
MHIAKNYWQYDVLFIMRFPKGKALLVKALYQQLISKNKIKNTYLTGPVLDFTGCARLIFISFMDAVC